MSKAFYQITAQSPDGLKLTTKGDIEIDAYNVVPVTIPAGAVDTAVELGTGSGAVNFLAVHDLSGKYDLDLTYKVNDDTAVVVLDGPLVMIGKGAVSLMSTDPAVATDPPVQPGTLTFNNARLKDAILQILVGRDPTPP